MEKFVTIITAIIAGLAVFAVTSAITGVLVMWLWNWLLVPIFNLCTITWLQGWGISFLSALLFKSNNTSNSSKWNK